MSKAYLLNSIIGEYRLVSFIGAGGMGEVYRAEHNKIGRMAAVKVLTQTLGAGFVERFFNEARIQASLQHPNIATLYDFLEVNGQPCIIMEYIDGVTLAERVRPHGALPLDEALNIFYPIVEAINYVHQHGVIHRDIKSSNIKISSGGQIKLLDFGIAKGQMSPGLTETGSVIGTLEYMSPEQLRGGHADARSDIWSLGVLLYEMVTGHVPFESKTIGELCEKIEKVQYTNPTQFNPSVPREVANVIARCLKHNAAERYQTARELLDDTGRLFALAAARQESETSQKNESAVLDDNAPQTSWVGRHWVLLAGGVAVVAILFILTAGSGAYMMWGGDETSTQQNITTNVAPSNQAKSATTKKVSIVLGSMLDSGDQAEVWENNRKINMTPYSFEGEIGKHVVLTLKHEGYEDYPVDFYVNNNKSEYRYTMKKK